MAADSGQRDALLHRDTDIRPAQHEGQMIERGRDHWIFERRHKRGPSLAGASPRQSHLDFVSALARQANDISEAEWRQQHRCCLGCELRRYDIHPDEKEKNDSYTSGRFHGDYACFMNARPDRRHCRRSGRSPYVT